jgi:hypothetical protein
VCNIWRVVSVGGNRRARDKLVNLKVSPVVGLTLFRQWYGNTYRNSGHYLSLEFVYHLTLVTLAPPTHSSWHFLYYSEDYFSFH